MEWGALGLRLVAATRRSSEPYRRTVEVVPSSADMESMLYSQSMNAIASFKSTSWRDPTKKEKNVDCHSMDRNMRVIPPSTDIWGFYEEPSWDSEEEPELFADMAERLASEVAVDIRETCGPIRRCRTRARLNIIESKNPKKHRGPTNARKGNSSTGRSNKS